MPNVVKLLRSTTPGQTPPSLVSGQIAINEADGKIFWLDANGVTIRSATIKDLDTIIANKLAKASNLSDLTNTATARTNLGLGSSATQNVGTASGNVVQLDSSARLPAVNGSLLTNVAAASVPATCVTGNIRASKKANALNATGSPPLFACRAWVSFNGATSTVLSSGNVSSITKLGTGSYLINYTTAMPDLLFAILGSVAWAFTSWNHNALKAEPYSQSQSRIWYQENGVTVDATGVYIAVYR